MNHAAQAASAGHVDAVVVLGAEVNRGEFAILELRGQCGVTTDLRLRAVAVAFGLEHLVAVDVAQLADRAVHGAHKRGIGQGACAGLEGSGEEVVEAFVLRDVWLGCLVHVHLVLAHKPLDEGMRPLAATRTCHSARKLRQQLFRHHILGENK